MIAFLPRKLALVFVLSFLVLAWNIWNVGIASGYIDSVRKLGAQDEAVYTREAIHMATQGNWLTLTYLDRFVLFKPPLLMWLSGLSAKLFGISSLPLRLPALLAGAFICLCVFRFAPRAGPAAVLLLLSDRLFHTLSRASLTDILLTAFLVGALFAYSRDVTLRSRPAFWGFALCCGFAILTKSIAGLLPFAIVAVCAVFGFRPTLRRLIEAAAVAAAVALPWMLYQFVVHREWFLAEFVGVQLLAFGGKPPQTSQENQVLFYLSRLVYSDPELAMLALLGLPGFFRRRREPLSILLFGWLLVCSAALLVFQYRSVQYMLPLIPALAILAAVYCPFFQRRTAIPLLLLAFAVKVARPEEPWGLPYGSGNTLPTAASLSQYCEQRRANDLIIIEPEDEFYSSVLPLAHVRYGWIDPNDANERLEPHLRYLGLTLSARQFIELTPDSPYRERLRSWGLDSSKPIGTGIFARTPSEMRQMIDARPDSDFLLPRTWLTPADLLTHDVVRASADRVLLIAKRRLGDHQPAWSCRM